MIADMNHKKNSLGFLEFVMPIAEILKDGEDYKIKHYSEITEGGVKSYRRIILSGAPLKDNKYLEDMEKFEWIKECGSPILGICAGMQVIGLIFNSALKRCQEIGMEEIETIKENPLFYLKFEAYELHNHTIEPSEDLEVIARSERCIQGVKVREKEIYGILFHPEVRNKDIVRRFVDYTPLS